MTATRSLTITYAAKSPVNPTIDRKRPRKSILWAELFTGSFHEVGGIWMGRRAWPPGPGTDFLQIEGTETRQIWPRLFVLCPEETMRRNPPATSRVKLPDNNVNE